MHMDKGKMVWLEGEVKGTWRTRRRARKGKVNII